ncbi:MAG: Uma2 family endonuclease [Pseudanabaena sp. LacPavin_0818_WC45_MAG_42_6]|nr:Uma2 family endonuclease [Pseudanabaena sp. LacPavin_0818_WC45_MAG_42_6]
MTVIAPPPIKQQADLADTRSQQLITDQWISATWDEFVQVLENPLYAESRCYYDTNQIKQMRIETMPVGSEHAVSLDESPAPNLVIEIPSSTINDDLGKKRLLYEQLGTSEYWVIDVQEVKIIALEMLENGGSRQIISSKLLGGLAIADLEAALKLSREKSQSEVGAWLLQRFAL